VDLVVVLEAVLGAELLLFPEDLVFPAKEIQAEALMATMVAEVVALALSAYHPYQALLGKAAQELRPTLQALG
jgi:hypothetical protein